jgi:hypothetical protein
LKHFVASKACEGVTGAGAAVAPNFGAIGAAQAGAGFFTVRKPIEAASASAARRRKKTSVEDIKLLQQGLRPSDPLAISSAGSGD